MPHGCEKSDCLRCSQASVAPPPLTSPPPHLWSPPLSLPLLPSFPLLFWVFFFHTLYFDHILSSLLASPEPLTSLPTQLHILSHSKQTKINQPNKTGKHTHTKIMFVLCWPTAARRAWGLPWSVVDVHSGVTFHWGKLSFPFPAASFLVRGRTLCPIPLG